MSAAFLEPCRCGHPRGDHFNTVRGMGMGDCPYDPCGCSGFVPREVDGECESEDHAAGGKRGAK